jgi:YHS domain-containing protein
MVRDFVCGMQVEENNPETPQFEYKAETYYFCTPLCRAQFEADPDRYIKESKKVNSARKHRGKGNPDG